MAESEVRVGNRVSLKDKGWTGVVRYVGSTMFAPGKWVGVELDEANGKNNGVVQGKTYFNCRDNHGIFVRQQQLQVLAGSRSPGTSRIPGPSGIPAPGSSQLRRPSAGASSTSPKMKQSKLASKSSGRSPPSQKNEKTSANKGPQAAVKQPAQIPEVTLDAVATEPPAPQGPPSDEVTDLRQRLAILQQKRADDKARIKELEKYKAQLMQMMEYKHKWSESQAELQQQLKLAKKEAREHQLEREKVEEEMRELSDAVEMSTLDKEMAEERSESLQLENEALKEKVEELTIDLEIIKQEISETGVEGAAANAQYKQMEQQNNRLKEALVRLRDLSAEEKLEHQRVKKDFEKNATELNLIKEQKEKLAHELQEAEAIIDELKEQVDDALGAEEMVEKLTDQNLDLEEKIEQLNETVADLEALRDLSEEQEELRLEVEHDLREELDMSLNSVRQSERKLEATQETIIDQQQTIEKFRELVRHLQDDITELREKGEKSSGGGSGGDSVAQSQTMMNLNVQLKSTMKAHARTIDFELRKLDAQQAAEHINLLKSFMPNTFLISGGDYDALLVLMLLPRLLFKAELIVDQLKQQHKVDDALGSLSSISPTQADQLGFACLLIYKLSSLQMLINRANCILEECDVQLYRQMGGVRDDLTIHEKALDVLIELLKKEQLDESVPLHGIDKAVGHFESLLDGRLRFEGSVHGYSRQLLDQTRVLMAGCDFITIELLRLRSLAPESSQFVTQTKELDSFNNDLRQTCRKVRRKVPPVESQRALQYDSTVLQSLVKVLRRQLLLTDTFKALQLKASQRANSLAEGEKMTSGELEDFIRQVVTSGTLLELGSEGGSSQKPQELLRSTMTSNTTSLDKFLTALGEGQYDTTVPKSKPERPASVRAHAVKSELSDVEGLGFKLEERQKDILELKRSLKLKGQELSEAGVKIGLLEKKVESADAETARQVSKEREETERIKDIMEEQERKFNKTIEILQGDIESLETDKNEMEKKLDQQTRKGMMPDISGRRLGSRGSPFASPFGSPFISRRVGSGLVSGAGDATTTTEGGDASAPGDQQRALQNPLLLARIESLRKALGFSQNENFRLKAQIAKAQLNSLPPLRVPRRLVIKRRSEEQQEEAGKEGVQTENQTDQEKSVLKRTAALIEELKGMSLPRVIVTNHPATEGAPSSPREQLSNQIARISQMQRKTVQLKQDVDRLLASQYPGGVVSSKVTSFTSPQFSKAVNESSGSAVLAARLRLPASTTGGGCGSAQRVVLSPAQFSALHSAIIT